MLAQFKFKVIRYIFEKHNKDQEKSENIFTQSMSFYFFNCQTQYF